MQLPLQTFTTLVQNAAAAVQGAATQLIDLTVGSVLRAVLEANASLALWMQWLTLLVLQTTRAATSTGTDLDSWMADFALTRLPAVAATGSVTFARFSTGYTALVPAGTPVTTADGTQTFSVLADPTNPAWSAAQNGFVLAASDSALTVAVQAATPGAAGNVQPAAISLLGAAIPGVDTVTNAAATAGGVDAESDAALRARFANYLASLSRATTGAIGYAVGSLQQGLQYVIAENVDTSGATRMGHFVVTVDDGTGTPPATLLATVAQAIEAVRPIGTTYAVQPPTVTEATIVLTITVAATAQKAALIGPVAAAITAYVNALPVGAPLPLARIIQLAYAASPSITNVTQITLNGAASDIVPPPSGVVKAALVAVN